MKSNAIVTSVVIFIWSSAVSVMQASSLFGDGLSFRGSTKAAGLVPTPGDGLPSRSGSLRSTGTLVLTKVPKRPPQSPDYATYPRPSCPTASVFTKENTGFTPRLETPRLNFVAVGGVAVASDDDPETGPLKRAVPPKRVTTLYLTTVGGDSAPPPPPPARELGLGVFPISPKGFVVAHGRRAPAPVLALEPVPPLPK